MSYEKKRIEKCFASISNRSAFIAYTMCGVHSLDFSYATMNCLVDSGVDILELGMPFSDPTAEGSTIQKAAMRALDNGVNLDHIFTLVARFRETNDYTPIVLMGYYNTVLHYGLQEFVTMCSQAGIDAVLIVDLPVDEENELCNYLSDSNLDLIRLVTPMTSEARFRTIVQDASGFIYYVSVNGVTGTKSPTFNSICDYMSKYQSLTDIPIVAGFGIKTPKQFRELNNVARGLVVGSAIVERISDYNSDDIAGSMIDLKRFVQDFSIKNNRDDTNA